MADQLQPDPFTQGALPARLVAVLSGLTPSRLAGWHRSRLLCATAQPGRRGVPRLYAWSDYARARAAAKLIEKGLPARKLRTVLAQLDRDHPDWPVLPLTAMAKRAVVEPPGALARTVEEPPQGAAFELIDEAPMKQEMDGRASGVLVAALPPEIDLETIWTEIRHEGPLGKLHRYGKHVCMDPAVREGRPVICGRRTETELLAALHAGGMSSAEIAEAYRLTTRAVAEALKFERALQAA